MPGQRPRGESHNSSKLRGLAAHRVACRVAPCAMVALLLVSILAVSLRAGVGATGPDEHTGPTVVTGSAGATTTSVGGAAGAVASNSGNVLGGGLHHLGLTMLERINQDRSSPAVADETKGRAKPLEWDPRLAAVAREHSEEMAATGNFSHRGMDGSAPMMRVSKAGIQWLATGENIAKIDLGWGFAAAGVTTADERVVTKAETLFMDEPKFKVNHRGNILNPAYNHAGIGIARAADGSFYITQEFAQVP